MSAFSTIGTGTTPRTLPEYLDEPGSLRLAFDVPATAQPGPYGVGFPDKNMLADEDGNEFGCPSALRQLKVTVVPQPGVAGTLLPGLALVGMRVHRAAARCG